MPEGKLSQEEFYKKYYPIVKDSVKGTGLFPETVIAQMAIESGWGGSGLTTKYNNYFGIKGGKGVSLETEEEVNGKRVSITDKFRVYNSVEDSIKDYVRLLTTNDKYKEVLKAKSPEEQAELIGNSPYSTSSTYGSSIKNTIKSNQDKTKAMATNDGNSVIQNQIKKVNALRNVDGESSEEYKKEKQKLESLLRHNIRTTQSAKESELKKNIETAKKNNDWDAYEKLGSELKEFEKTKIDFNKVQNDNYGATGATSSPTGLTTQPGQKTDMIVGADFDILLKTYEQYNPKPTEQLVQKDKRFDVDYQEGGSGSGGGTSQTSEVNVRNHDPNGVAGNGKDMTLTPQESKTELENIDKELEAYRNIEQYDFQPTDSYQNETDLLGTAIDVGRGVVGMIGATKEVPKYQRGSMFTSAMNRADARKDMGLSPEEMAFRERQGEEAYAYDVKNISRAAGGNAGAYLGNVGNAVARLYGNKSAMAAENEAVKRVNNQNFQGMALKDEQINRQIFLDDLNLTMMDKQAGAGLVQDAMSNIQNRLDYNRQFGNNSIYGKYMNAQTNAMNQATYDLGYRARNNPLFKKNELELRKQKLLQEQEANMPTIGTDVNKEIKQPGLVTRKVEDVVVSPDSEFNSVNATEKRDIVAEENLAQTRKNSAIQEQDLDFEEMESGAYGTNRSKKAKTKTRRRLITSNK